MMTSRLGEIEIREEDVLIFTHGIPGFDEYSRYVIVSPEEIAPFRYLQSLENEGLSFIITDPFAFHASYEFDLPEDVTELLNIKGEDEVAIWSLVSVRDNLQEATMNLLAPIVVNKSANLAKQVILHDTSYMIRHKLFSAGK